MKLDKLQKLAEGASQDSYGKVNKIFDPLHDKLEALHDAAEFIRKQLQSSVLNDVLKQEGFPATEAKAAKDAAEAVRKAVGVLEDEISQLHQAIGTHFDSLNEAKEPSNPMPPENEERIIRKVLASAEDNGLAHEARYKSWDTDPYMKTVDWITQETNPAQSKEAAKLIAKLIRSAGVRGTGWTLRVVVRDDYNGDKTKWHAKIKV